MDIRILDLDGSLPPQQELFSCYHPAVFDARPWGPEIRLACSFGRFRRFEQALVRLFGTATDASPAITLYGSGDFHHVSLALVRRLKTPVNLLVLDNHPDWMRGVPFLHCGTWLYHAARLPHVERVFHVGGNVDFDNHYQWLAPWRLLRSGKITVLSSIRRFQHGSWSHVSVEPIRSQAETPASADRIAEVLRPFQDELACRPLYISLDKDVLVAKEAVVNWDSGQLTLAEVLAVLDVFLRMAGENFAGMDIVGDWSPVRLRGWSRHIMHLTMHPALAVDATDATSCNDRTNLAVIHRILSGVSLRAGPVVCASHMR